MCFSEASLNQNVRAAKIPWGSFYQYFNDKEDIYLYTGSEKEENLEKWKELLPLQNPITISIDDPVRFRGAAHRHSPDQKLFI